MRYRPLYAISAAILGISAHYSLSFGAYAEKHPVVAISHDQFIAMLIKGRIIDAEFVGQWLDILADDADPELKKRPTSLSIEHCHILYDVRFQDYIQQLSVENTEIDGETIGAGIDSAVDWTFEDVTFARGVTLRHFKEGSRISFERAKFADSVAYDGSINKGIHKNAQAPTILSFKSCDFEGPTLFRGEGIDELRLSRTWEPNRKYGGHNTTLASDLTFADVVANKIDIFSIVARGRVHFFDCDIRHGIRLDNSVFEEEVSFEHTSIRDALLVNDVTFRRGWEIDWRTLTETSMVPLTFWTPESKLRGSIDPQRPVTSDTWRRLGAAWTTTGDTFAANEALYQRQLIEYPYSISRVFWGYGVRPWRCALWVLGFWAVCGGVYFTQTKAIRGLNTRISCAALYAWRAGWEWKFGWENGRTATWKCFGLLEQVIFKSAILLFLHSLANTAPLLHDLMERQLHL